MKTEEKYTAYLNWVGLMVKQLKAHEDEMREAFSHNEPFYVAGLLNCFGFKVKEDALDFAKDVFCNAGYFPCNYNFDISKWETRTGEFIVEITKKENK